jgi:DNA primase
MYDTRLTDIELSLDSILSKVTEYDIYSYYIGSSFKLGTVMSSPFRQDKNPSFGIFKSNKYSTLLYKDYGTGNTGNCVQLVQELFNISYREALIKILGDLVNNNLKRSVEGITIKEDYESVSTVISVKRKNFCKTDDDYWGQYGLFRDDLRHFNVFPIHSYWINEIVQPWAYKWDNPGYAYQVYNKYKIYKPLSPKKYKWVGNCSNYDIQGYEQLTYKDDLVIITKSLKDVMVLHKLGYNAIAPQGENHSIPKEVITDLQNRFNHIVIFYDNDEAGVAGANKIATKYNLKTIFIPNNYPKDISDYIKQYGVDNSKQLLNTLLNEYIKAG